MPTTLALIQDTVGPTSVATQVDYNKIEDNYLETTFKFQVNDGSTVATLDFSFFGMVDTASGREEVREQIATERVALDNLVNALLHFQREFNDVANRALAVVTA